MKHRGFMEYFNEIEIDNSAEKFKYISNYNKFTDARKRGKIDSDLLTMLEFLKYECENCRRDIIISRLFDLAMTAYKKEVREELEKLYPNA